MDSEKIEELLNDLLSVKGDSDQANFTANSCGTRQDREHAADVEEVLEHKLQETIKILASAFLKKAVIIEDQRMVLKQVKLNLESTLLTVNNNLR